MQIEKRRKVPNKKSKKRKTTAKARRKERRAVMTTRKWRRSRLDHPKSSGSSIPSTTNTKTFGRTGKKLRTLLRTTMLS